jgi:hypothetical protein
MIPGAGICSICFLADYHHGFRFSQEKLERLFVTGG